MKWSEAAWSGGELKRTSDAPVPWKSGRVSLIWISERGVIKTTCRVTGKIEALKWAGDNDLLLVAWPGKWRQDVFLVDDRQAALGVLKPGPFKARGSVTPITTRQDATPSDRHDAMAAFGALLREA